MKQHLQRKGRVAFCWIGAVLAAGLLLIGITDLLQTVWSHRRPVFVPAPPRAEIHAILQKGTRTERDYHLLFQETGLSPTAIEELLDQGADGYAVILETQKGFHAAPEAQCVPLIGGRFTCQDLLRDEQGEPVESVPIAALRPGDLLVSFSTHTMGWRHGHAGLVIDPAKGTVLEAVQLGVNSYLAGVQHWQHYSNFMVLCVQDATRELGQRVARFARKHLEDIPYSLLAGLLGDKAQVVEEGPGVHCAYLPWYAWNSEGVDLDANGGAIVTVGDLARSPELEVIQVYGMDPAQVEHRVRGL